MVIVRAAPLKLPSGVVLRPAPTVAVAMMGDRLGPLAVLQVGPMVLMMATAVQLCISERCPRLSVVPGLEVGVALGAGGSGALWHHLQVGSDAVAAGAGLVAEVDHAAFIGAFVRRFDPGEAELVGDVAAHDLHNLATTDEEFIMMLFNLLLLILLLHYFKFLFISSSIAIS